MQPRQLPIEALKAHLAVHAKRNPAEKAPRPEEILVAANQVNYDSINTGIPDLTIEQLQSLTGNTFESTYDADSVVLDEETYEASVFESPSTPQTETIEMATPSEPIRFEKLDDDLIPHLQQAATQWDLKTPECIFMQQIIRNQKKLIQILSLLSQKMDQGKQEPSQDEPPIDRMDAIASAQTIQFRDE